ncbi:glycoside hydrolase family 17 protein [Xylaria nigripes]|nr:glycoside hydrolase family 17 protein [Xylaria nigripes]
MGILTIILAVLSLIHLSLGQPRHHHGAGPRHRAQRNPLQKKDAITITDAQVPARTELPEVVVYVDQYGNMLSTATEMVVYIPKETPPPEPSSPPTAPPSDPPPPVSEPASSVEAPAPVASATLPSPAAESVPEPSSDQQSSSETPLAASASASLPVSSAPPDTQPSGNELHGVTYSPYKGNGNCKTADEVDRDFALFSKDYGVVRLYGVDCDQVSTVSKAAKKYGNKLFLGIYNINAIDSDVATMATGVDHDWSMVDTVSVGNELVNNGGASVAQSLAALTEARSALRAAGYQGPVVVVDTFVAVLNHPELCDQSDYCAINCHPFFDSNTEASGAGSFVNSIVTNVRNKLSDKNKRIVVTETGWPWQGWANGAAVPGLDTQTTAISSIKGAFSSNAGDVFLFTAFNDLWKKPAAGTFMAEQFWGMGGRYSPADQ